MSSYTANSYTANSTSQNDKRDTPMSATSEGASNGFTAVNGPPQSPSIGRSLDHILPNPRPQQDWQPIHPEPPTNHGPYHVGPNKRSFADMDTQEDSRRQAQPPINSSEMGPHKGSEPPNGEAGQGQAHPAAQSSSGWNLSEDQRIAQLLQQGDDPRPENGINTSPNGGDHMHSSDNSLQFEEHTIGDGRIITSAGVHVDMKKRKRAFTNRTKTGCQTCRRRKKKCDEAKPACNNCIRGGFTCLGYAKTRDVAKQTPNRGALNLLPAHARDRDFSWEVRSAPRYDQSSALPAGLPESRQSLDGRLNSNSWSSSPAYNGSTPRPIGAEPRLPPLQFNRADAQPTQRYNPMNAARAGLQDLVQNQNNQNEARNYAVVPPATYDPNNEGYFKPEDQQYASRRKACREACGKFNRAACDGTSAEELRRLLKAIVKPDGQTTAFGGLGQGYQFPDAITVDAPFNAEYGHNLNIGKNVRIGSNCSFKDAKQITIGDGARIGSDVVITGECDPPPGQSPEYKYAATIRIGANVVIGTRTTVATGYHEIIIGDNTQVGPGCVIASRGARVSIGKDCTLGPGCVITSDVPEGSHLVAPQAQAAQPAYR